MSDTPDLAVPAMPAPAAAPPSAELTPAQLAEAKEYGRLSLWCDLADKALDVAFLTVMGLVFAVPADNWLAGFLPSALPRLIALFVLLTLVHAALSFPLSYYAGYVLEHRFSLSRQSLAKWLTRYAKRNLLALAFGAVMIPGLYALIWSVGDYWWLAAAGAFFLVTVLLGQLTPVLILPLFYKVEPLDNPDLIARLARLAEGTGLSIQGVYRLGMSEETAKANAMLTGLGRSRRVLMGDTLLDEFTGDELEVIFAHEIGHHVFRHIHKMVLVGVLYSLAGFWLCDRLLLAWASVQAGAPVSAADMPTSTLPLMMLVLTVFSLLLEPLQNAISRRYERQCDRYALDRTGLREAYLSAFRKLARLNKDDPAPHPLEVLLFHSHPPIRERLTIAQQAGL